MRFAPAFLSFIPMVWGNYWILDLAPDYTEALFGRDPVRRYPSALQRTMLRKLVAVDAAESLQDLRSPPGNRLEKLRGDLAAPLVLKRRLGPSRAITPW